MFLQSCLLGIIFQNSCSRNNSSSRRASSRWEMREWMSERPQKGTSERRPMGSNQPLVRKDKIRGKIIDSLGQKWKVREIEKKRWNPPIERIRMFSIIFWKVRELSVKRSKACEFNVKYRNLSYYRNTNGNQALLQLLPLLHIVLASYACVVTIHILCHLLPETCHQLSPAYLFIHLKKKKI